MRTKIPNLILRDYHNNNLGILKTAYNINEENKFNDISTLTFTIPYYQYNGYGEQVVDENGNQVVNYKIDNIKNENLIEFDDKFYIIKKVRHSKDRNNKKVLIVECMEKLVELSYKNIAFLSMKPPMFNPVRIDAALLNLLTVKFELDRGNVTDATTNTVTLSNSASSNNDEYNGNWIVFLDGTGQGQKARITDYDGSTKVATLDRDFDYVPDSSTLYRVSYTKWTIGNIEDDFLSDNSGTIYRSHEFKDETILNCVKKIAGKYGGNMSITVEYNETYDEFVNKLNIIKPKIYDNVEFRYKKNLEEIEKIVDSRDNIYTRIYPYGDNNLAIQEIEDKYRTDNGIRYKTHEEGQSYIENFKYYLGMGYDIDFCREHFVNDYELNNNDYVDVNDLYNDAEEELEGVSVPKTTYKVSAYDLAKTTDYPYEKFEAGDTVRVVDNEFNIDFFATVINKPVAHDNPIKSRLELANFVEDTGDYIVEILNKSYQNTTRNKVFGKTTDYIIADKETSKNWRSADYVLTDESDKDLGDVLENIIENAPINANLKITILSGTYKIRDAKVIEGRNDIVIEGIGSSTILVPEPDLGSDTRFLYLRDIDNLYINNLTFKSNKNTGKYFSTIFSFEFCENVDLDGIRVNYVSEKVATFFNTNQIRIQNNRFDFLTNTSVSFQTLFFISSCNKFEIDNNYFDIQGFSVSELITINADNGLDENVSSSIHKNYFRTVSDIDKILDIIGINSTVDIYDNTVFHEYEAGNYLNMAFDISSNGNVNINNNLIDGYMARAIELNSGDNSKVSGNEIATMADTANWRVYVNSNNAQIIDNKVRNVSVRVPGNVTYVADDIGIYNVGDNNIIAHNDLRNAGVTDKLKDVGSGTATLGGNVL